MGPLAVSEGVADLVPRLWGRWCRVCCTDRLFCVALSLRGRRGWYAAGMGRRRSMTLHGSWSLGGQSLIPLLSLAHALICQEIFILALVQNCISAHPPPPHCLPTRCSAAGALRRPHSYNFFTAA